MGRKKKFENRFEVIVEMAAQLFSQYGFADTTMEDIAKACNLGKATLYTDFKSKEDLMQAVIIWHIQNTIRQMKQKLEQAQDNYLEVLRKILLERVLGTYDRANRHFHSIEIMMAARDGTTEKGKVHQHREEELRIIANLLEKAALNNEIAHHNNYFQLSTLLRKGLTGLFPPNIFGVTREAFEADAREIIDIYLRGLTIAHRATEDRRRPKSS